MADPWKDWGSEIKTATAWRFYLIGSSVDEETAEARSLGRSEYFGTTDLNFAGRVALGFTRANRLWRKSKAMGREFIGELMTDWIPD